jgi:hypothetical protein
MRLSVSELLSDISADATTIGLDMPGRGYDRLHEYLESSGKLPTSKAGRTALIAVMVLASRIVKQQLGLMGPIANFVNEIGEDAVREQAKRLLETVMSSSRDPITVTPPASWSSSPHTGMDAVWEMDDTMRAQLFERFRSLDPAGQQRLRDELLRSTTLQLARLAGLSVEDLRTILDIYHPAAPPRVGFADRVAVTLFPWLK